MRRGAVPGAPVKESRIRCCSHVLHLKRLSAAGAGKSLICPPNHANLHYSSCPTAALVTHLCVFSSYLIAHAAFAPLKMYNMCLSLQYPGNISQLAPDLGGRMECREGWRWHALIPARMDPPFLCSQRELLMLRPPTHAGLACRVVRGRLTALIMEFLAAVWTPSRPRRVSF